MSTPDEPSDAFVHALKEAYSVTESAAFSDAVRARLEDKGRRGLALPLIGFAGAAALALVLALPLTPEPTDAFTARGEASAALAKRVGFELYMYPDTGERQQLRDRDTVPTRVRLAVRILNRSDTTLEAVVTVEDASGTRHRAIPAEADGSALPVFPNASTPVQSGGFELTDFPPGGALVRVRLSGGSEPLEMSMPLRVR